VRVGKEALRRVGYTSMRKVGYLANIAFWPGVSTLAYCWWLAGVTEYSGLSAAYGSMWKVPTRYPAGGLVMPPSQAGMVPAALPAFSAPTGVSSPPSLAASSGLTAAWAMPVASTAAPAMAARVNFCLVFILCLPVASEGILDGERREVAVVDLVVTLGAAEAGVAQVEHQLVQVGRLQTQGQRLATLEEVAARAGGDAADVMVERNTRRQVDRAAEDAGVLGAGRHPVAPGERGREAAGERLRVAQATEHHHARAREAGRQGVGDVAAAGGVGAFALITQLVVRRQVPDFGGADLADHGDLVGTQYLAEQLGEGHLDLGDLMLAPAADLLAQRVLAELAVELQARHRDERVQ